MNEKDCARVQLIIHFIHKTWILDSVAQLWIKEQKKNFC